jgi:hypothetical protein
MNKFSRNELSSLQQHLSIPQANSWQVAELLQLFLADRGYGASPEQARAAAARIGCQGSSLEALAAALDSLALAS